MSVKPILFNTEMVRAILDGRKTVTDVRVERLQEIDGHSVLAEGVDNGKSNPTMKKRWENMQRMAFLELWNGIIKPAGRRK